MKNKTVIFLHLPKTGGLTLSKIASDNYAPEAIYRIDGRRPQESTKDFNNLPEEHRMKVDFIEGHLTFGIHKHIPKPSTYITILRDPVDRVLSAYYYMLENTLHPFHEQTKQFTTFEEFLESKIFRFMNNGQVRLLSDSENFNYGECPKELADISISNLENHFSLIGLLEKFDEFLLSCSKELNWHYPIYTRVNVTKNRLEKNKISDKAREIISRDNQLDIEIYEYCKKIVNERLNKNSVKIKTLTFKQINKLYNISTMRYPMIQRSIEKVSRIF